MMKDQRFTAYYYDPAKEQAPGIDSNELSVNGKFLSIITEVRSNQVLEDLVPRTKTEEIVLIVPDDTDLDISISIHALKKFKIMDKDITLRDFLYTLLDDKITYRVTVDFGQDSVTSFLEILLYFLPDGILERKVMSTSLEGYNSIFIKCKEN